MSEPIAPRSRALLPQGPPAPGRLLVLACMPPLCPHVEFGISDVLGAPISLTWSEQPARPGTLRAELEYGAPAGAADGLATRLRGIGPIWFEVIEGAVAGADAHRYSYDPDLGLHHAPLAANGDVQVPEGPLRALLGRSRDVGELHQGLSRLLGDAWDTSLDPLRAGAEGASVTWLRRTG